MYFGISGDGSSDGDPIWGQAKRDGNIIKWDRPNVNNLSDDGRSSDVPISFFRELY